MIAVDDAAGPLADPAFGRPGGFAWWYLDHLGEDGAAVVLIPSFGLPFLPGRGRDARAGRAGPASDAPSLNVVVVREDRPAFYLLQAYRPEDASRSADEIRLGRSRFTSSLHGDTRVFHAELDCALPGTGDRLRGTVHLEGPAVRLTEGAPDAPHRWTPLAVGTSDVDLTVGGERLATGPGRAYHDRNGSELPLHALGIRHWIWGRNAFPDGELVTYALWPESGAPPEVHAWWLHPDGRSEVIADRIALGGARLGAFGMPWWRRQTFDRGDQPAFTVDVRAVVDDGPFYLRFHTDARRADGAVGAGVAEAVRPARVDQALLRPLVRMAVHDTAGANSPWLPLFAGTRQDRWARLLGTRLPLLAGATP